MNSTKDYPLFLYLYSDDGFYSEPIDIPTRLGLEMLMKTAIRDAIKHKREVRITDTDDYLVFHAYKGCIKWDSIKHHECDECKEETK